MSAAAPMGVHPSEASRSSVAWQIALAGLAVMYVPVYWWAANVIWQTEEHGHGPLILAVIAWLFWTLREPIMKAPYAPAPLAGWPVFIAGLLVYALGRFFNVSIFEFGSQILVVAGALLLMKGLPALRVAWFAVVYLAFLVPLPGPFVDALTGPLKHWVSVVVQHILFAVGYPIGNTGVILSIGQYQLMVADACSGLNSMFSLTALGTLFMYITGRKSLLHNAIMLASILPIAFGANIVRVIVLVLITYHLGDEAGQGFLHGAAGIVLMLVAFGIFFMVDWALLKLLPSRSAPSPG